MMYRFSPAVLLVLLCVGCSAVESDVTELSLQVKPSSQRGTYALSGGANVPDGTEVTVQAVRQLENLDLATTALESDQFSILDRQLVKVEAGEWKATLRVWQPAADGELAEPWQVYGLQDDRQFEPENQVSFTVTTPPSNDPKALERQWEASQNNPEGQQVGFTTEGRWYLQASQPLPLEPPVVSSASETASKEAIAVQSEGSAQGRPQVVQVEPEAAGAVMQKALTNAPLSPQEQFQ